MKRKMIVGTLFSVFLYIHVYSQLQVGGNFGFGASNNYMSLDISPEVSYSLSQYVTLGTSPFYLYNKSTTTAYWSKMYGFRVFAEAHYKIAFLRTEYEYSWYSNSEKTKSSLSSLPIGIGVTTAISSRAVAYVMVLYDILYDEAVAVQTNPIFRTGVRYKF